MRALLNETKVLISNNDAGMAGRMNILIESFYEELIEELDEHDPEEMRQFFMKNAGLFIWLGTGDFIGLSPELEKFVNRLGFYRPEEVVEGELVDEMKSIDA
jgi:hypothetical protein